MVDQNMSSISPTLLLSLCGLTSQKTQKKPILVSLGDRSVHVTEDE